MTMKVNNISFGKWNSVAYYKILDQIKSAANSKGLTPEKTKIYNAFQYLHNNTIGGDLVIDEYNSIKDKNNVYSYFPSTDKKDNVIFRNIIASKDYFEKYNLGRNESEIGLVGDDSYDSDSEDGDYFEG